MSRRAPYGILPSDFWTSDDGRAIQARGKDAVILSDYLRANPQATMLGFYRLRVEEVLHQLPVLETREAVRAAFAALAAVGFALYDEPTACVWVRDMARERLNLEPSAVLDPEDHRRTGAQRLYEALPPNPFLEPFFDLYGRALRLKRRTFAQAVFEIPPVENSEGEGAYKPLTSPLQGASHGTSTSVPGTDQEKQDQYVRDQEDRSERTAPQSAARLPLIGSITFRETSRTPNGTNYHVIAKAARELLTDPDLARKYLEVAIDTQADLVDATKNFCAAKGIDYGRRDPVPFDVVHRACASEWAKARMGVQRDKQQSS